MPHKDKAKRNAYSNALMKKKYDKVSFFLDKEKFEKQRFNDLCKDRGTNASEVLRKFVREMLKKYDY